MFFSCTKDVGIIPPPPPSERHKALTQNYWRLIHLWEDTSQAAKDNPMLVPLSTSYDNTYYPDSCAHYKGEKFSEDGFIYAVKGIHCGCTLNPPCLSPYGGGNGTPWKFDANETKIYYAQRGYTILQLDNNTLSYYSYQTYNFTKKLVEVSIYKSYTDW